MSRATRCTCDCDRSVHTDGRGPCFDCTCSEFVSDATPPVLVTGDTITDDQIRELAGPGCDRSGRRICKIALNDAPTYLKESVVRDARRRCAEIWNAKSRDGAG